MRHALTGQYDVGHPMGGALRRPHGCDRGVERGAGFTHQGQFARALAAHRGCNGFRHVGRRPERRGDALPQPVRHGVAVE
jgi:hypothetical protein